jgi:hypothetical protein
MVVGNNCTNLLSKPCRGECQGLRVEEADTECMVCNALFCRHWGGPRDPSSRNDLEDGLFRYPLNLRVLEIMEVPEIAAQ